MTNFFHSQKRPMLQTFISDYQREISSLVSHPCSNFEYRVLRCYEAYGYKVNQPKCESYLADFKECIFQGKRINRVHLMQAEKEKQKIPDDAIPIIPEHLF